MRHARLLIPGLLTLVFLAVYARTAAPGLLSGDSAEFQLVAVTLGVAHPTTYPLYTLLGHLATRLLPFGELAWRVTMLSVGCAALAVGVHASIVQRLGLRQAAVVLSGLLLGVTPGLWNAATLAEVYALLALLMLVAALVLLPTRPTRSSQVLVVGLCAGLGFTHHGLFTLTTLPLIAAWAFQRLRRQPLATQLHQGGWLLAGFGLGLLPWLYPCIQYARYGPFAGEDYGLPVHYFWGAPQSLGQVFDLLTGGTLRRGIFRFPSPDQALQTFTMLRERALFEYGWLGLALALVGCGLLFQRERKIWLASVWVLAATSAYLFALGPAVADAPVFTLPMLLPTALWIAVGVEWLLGLVEWLLNRPGSDSIHTEAGMPGQHTMPHQHSTEFARSLGVGRRLGHHGGTGLVGRIGVWVVLAALVAASLWWADTRVEYASKRQLTLYRSFAEATLASLPRDAVVLAHWEQGMSLQYLRLVEHQRPDVWVDVVEPGDEAWGARIARRYAGRPVFLIGQAPDVAGLPVELVREDSYALLFGLR